MRMPPGTFKNLLAIAALLIGAILLIEFSAAVLQAWATKKHGETEQGRLLHSHWVDKPIGLIG
jgi:hypothetical protein